MKKPRVGRGFSVAVGAVSSWLCQTRDNDQEKHYCDDDAEDKPQPATIAVAVIVSSVIAIIRHETCPCHR